MHSKTEERNCVGITNHCCSAPLLPSPPPLPPLLAPLLVLPPPLMHKAMLLALLLLALPSPLKLPLLLLLLLQLPSLKPRFQGSFRSPRLPPQCMAGGCLTALSPSRPLLLGLSLFEAPGKNTAAAEQHVWLRLSVKLRP